MPDLSFHVDGAEAVAFAATPTLAFKLRIANAGGEKVHSVLLRCQIQIETVRRRYDGGEQSRLSDLFGPPEEWSRTLRTLFWTRIDLSVPGFVGETAVDLPVPCTYDFDVAATKYFDGLADGEAPLCLLFSGTVFYATEGRPVQVFQIPWEKEANFRLPVRVWREMMDRHHPNAAWLSVRKDVFDRLRRYKSRCALPTWENALESLLDRSEEPAGIDGGAGPSIP